VNTATQNAALSPNLQVPLAPILSSNCLSVGYRNRKRITVTLRNIDVQVHTGELIAMVGSNGAGKSTLLRSLTGIQPPIEGNALLFGDPIFRVNRRQRAQHIALVLADRLEVANLTVRETVALGRHPHTNWGGTLDHDDETIVGNAMNVTDVQRFADRPVAELSDGERQRVAIARAVAQQPDVMVLDEPTAFLDPRARVRTMSLLRSLTRNGEFAAIVASHDLELVLPHADQIWVVGDGTLITGTLHEPAVQTALSTQLGAQIVTIGDRTHVIYEQETL
jgi:iron complex transport system ATP-binding protein